MPSNEVWGIDIGRSALKAVKMRRTKDQVEIVAIDIIEYAQPAETENVDREEQVRQALIEFQTRNKVKNDRIYASIPGQATFNRLITIPPVESKRVREIVTYEAQQQIPFPINEVLWDYQLIGGRDKTVEEREVMLFAVRREIINNFLNNLAAAQLNVDGIQIAPLAIYNFIRYEKPDMEACVAVDIGAENTDLVVIDGEKLWLRALPAAGSDITKALQKRFNIPYGEAEKLKLKAGKTKQAKKIFEVMKPVLKDIVGEIHRSVGYYKSMAKEIKFQRMVFMGNVTKLAGFDKFFEQNLQYELEILSELKRIRVSPKINVNLFQTNIPSFAVAMGLAIQGLGLSCNQIRLLPEEIWIREAMRRQRTILAIGVGILGVIPIWLWYSKSQVIDEVKRSTTTVDRTLTELQDQETQIQSVANYSQYENELLSLTKIGMYRDIWIAILEEFNQIYLDSIEKSKKQKSSKIWILEFDIDSENDQYKIGDNFENIPYLATTIRVAFESLGDEVRNRDYVLQMLREPLEARQYKGRTLFDKRRSQVLAADMKEILFPGEPPRGNQYYHVALKLVSWLDRHYLGEIESKHMEALNNQEFSPELNQALQTNQIKLGEDVRIMTKVRDGHWIIQDVQHDRELLVYNSGNMLRIYQKVK